MKLPSPLLRWFEQRRASQCHRQLLVISGDKSWAKMAATSIIGLPEMGESLWVGNASTAFETLEIKDFRTKLGQEYDCVVIDCFSGFRASAAMALSGTIRAQGCMILVCPEFSSWPSYQDPEQVHRTSFGFNNSLLTSRFIQYLTSCFNKQNFVSVLTEDHFSGELCDYSPATEYDLYSEQKRAVSAICKVAEGRNKRPLLLTADRGRGKSSALGIAAAKLMQTRDITIWLTAPTIANVDQVFSHCLQQIPDAVFDKYNLSVQNSVLAFKAIDQLLLTEELPEILFVDEASAIPVHVLVKLSHRYTRMVFSSTVHGYEGSGRGFEIKFKQLLLNIRPQYKSLHLTQPIRWFDGDVLEAFWFQTLFYQSKCAALENHHLDDSIQYKVISQEELLVNKNILAEVFALLLDAHYQTSPDDLQRLLDAPDIKLVAIMQRDKVLAIAQILEEGGDPLKVISAEIAANEKRVKGHLVAQNIASSYNRPEFCKAKQWRISRIAVHTLHHSMGLGTQLLDYVESLAIQERVELLTVAFGATSPLLRFWHRLGFEPVKLSFKPEISSGEHSCIHVKPLSTALLQLNQDISTEFFNDLVFHMDKDLSHLSAEILLDIFIHINHKITSPDPDRLNQFIAKSRNLTNCKRILVFSLLSLLSNLKRLTKEEQTFLASLLLQNRSHKDVARMYGLSGKKQIEEKVRGLFTRLL